MEYNSCGIRCQIGRGGIWKYARAHFPEKKKLPNGASEAFTLCSLDGCGGLQPCAHDPPRQLHAARAMLFQIANKLPSSAGHTPAESGVPSEVECEQLLAFTNHDRSRIITEVLERFAEAALYESGRSLRPSLAVNAQVAGPRREPRMTRQANMNGRSERIPRTGSCTTTYGSFLFELNRAARRCSR
jgi:hypothetical protein